MKTAIIVNGKPRSGKDTVVRMMGDILTGSEVPWGAFSSIDPIRTMLTNAGFDVSQKTDEDRDLLAAVGDAVETHSKFRSSTCVWCTVDFFEGVQSDHAAMFIHVREAAIIERIRMMLNAWPTGPYRTVTIQVVSPRAKDVVSNAADANTADIDYDYTINNDSTLDDLARRADRALFTLGVTPALSLLPS